MEQKNLFLLLKSVLWNDELSARSVHDVDWGELYGLAKEQCLIGIVADSFQYLSIRYGSATVIIGGDGNKESRTYQENPKLDKEVKMLSRISNMITSALRDKDIKLNEDGTFSGNLLLED